MDDETWDAPAASDEEPIETAGSSDEETVAKVKKTNREAAALRERTKEAEALAAALLEPRMSRFADVMPEGMSLTQQAAWLDKMDAKYPLDQAGSAAPQEESAAQEAPTETERQLATATGGPATGTSLPVSDISGKEIAEIGRTDPVRATEIIQQIGKDEFERRSDPRRPTRS